MPPTRPTPSWRRRLVGRGGRVLRACAVLVLALAGDLGAQLARPGALSLALGDHTTAIASGVDAIAANPAGLSDGPEGLGLTLLPLRLGVGLDPVTATEIGEFQGGSVPFGTRVEWLERIREEGRERGSASAAATLVAATSGEWGVQLSTLGAVRADLNPDAAELLLFGNAGRAGPRPFDLAGSKLDGWLVSTLGVAHGRSLGSYRGGRLSVGVTAKLSVGHAVVVGEDIGSTLATEPLDVRLRFPLLSTDLDEGDLAEAVGVGLDVGARWTGARLRLGIAVRNVFHTLEWRARDLVFRPGTALFDQVSDESDFDERPGEEAPDRLVRALAGMRFRPDVSLGAAYRTGEDLLLVAGLDARSADGLRAGPAVRVGVGAEYVPLARLPLRAHLGVTEDGLRGGGGLAVRLGRVVVAGSAAFGVGGSEEAVSGAFSVTLEP